MLMLTAAVQSTKPDYVALAMVLVLAVIVAIMAVRKAVSNKKSAAAPAPITPNSLADQPKAATAPGSAGQIKLNNVDPRTAAMVMAIVANKLDKPLNELRFISIKEVQ